MHQMPQTQNNNQPAQIGQLIQQLYKTLSFGQKRRLMLQYIALYGTRRTFYRKVGGQVRLLNSEKVFFQNQLQIQANNEHANQNT